MNQVKALQLLTQGFKNDLAQSIYEDEKFTELMMELSIKFVEDNVPIVEEDVKFELALMLMETLNLSTY
tara:strand:+ start:337 stop:543 length:207 start_codon:yes stop_codon:yes gene_type:complete